MKNNILVIAAHPDDEIIGVGGTISKHIINGDLATALIMGEGQLSRSFVNNKDDTLNKLHQNSLDACKIIGYKDVIYENLPDNKFDSLPLLDIIKLIEKHIEKVKPNIIYTHFYGDLNIDHQMTIRAVVTATRPFRMPFVKKIFCFETLSSTELTFNYDNVHFTPNYFVDISDTLKNMINAIEEYVTEIGDFPHPRSSDSIVATAKKWGAVCNLEYAEAFCLLRSIN